MTDYFGVQRFCAGCAFATTKWKSLYCNNKDSAFYKRKVNSVLLAPCFTPKERGGHDASGQSG